MIGLAITLLLFTYGVVASFVKPFHGLLVYVALAILKPVEMWPWSVPNFEYSRVIALTMVAGWLLHGCGRMRLGGGAASFGLFLAFWLWCVAGLVVAPDPSLAWVFVDAIGKLLLAFLVGLTLIDSVAQLRQLAWVIVLCSGYFALQMNLSYLAGGNQLYFVGFAGMDNNSAAIGLVTALGVALVLGLRGCTGWQRGVALGVAVLVAHAILFSFSRGAMLASAVATITVFLVIPRTPRTVLAFSLFALGAVALAGADVQARFSTAFESGEDLDASARSRLDLWADCWDVMSRHPILGAGPDHWPTLAASYGWAPGKEAHSLWMQTGAETGFPGLFLLAAFYGVTIDRCRRLTGRRALRQLPDPWLAEAARMVVMSLVGYVVAVQFVSLEGLEVPYYVALLGAGTLKLSRRRVPVAVRRGGERSVRPAVRSASPAFSSGPTFAT